MIGDLQPFRRTGVSFNDKMSEPPIIKYNQATANISRWGHGDWNVSFISMESSPGLQWGGIRWSGNESIRMNAHGTIGGNSPQGTRWGGFNIFNYVVGISDLSTTGALWHGKAISENTGYDSLFKNTGREIVLELKKMGVKILKLSFKRITLTKITLT